MENVWVNFTRVKSVSPNDDPSKYFVKLSNFTDEKNMLFSETLTEMLKEDVFRNTPYEFSDAEKEKLKNLNNQINAMAWEVNIVASQMYIAKIRGETTNYYATNYYMKLAKLKQLQKRMQDLLHSRVLVQLSGLNYRLFNMPYVDEFFEVYPEEGIAILNDLAKDLNPCIPVTEERWPISTFPSCYVPGQEALLRQLNFDRFELLKLVKFSMRFMMPNLYRSLLMLIVGMLYKPDSSIEELHEAVTKFLQLKIGEWFESRQPMKCYDEIKDSLRMFDIPANALPSLWPGIPDTVRTPEQEHATAPLIANDRIVFRSIEDIVEFLDQNQKRVSSVIVVDPTLKNLIVVDQTLKVLEARNVRGMEYAGMLSRLWQHVPALNALKALYLYGPVTNDMLGHIARSAQANLRLTMLILRSSALDGIPDEVYELDSLRTLDIDGNYHATLFSGRVAQLTKLRVLEIKNTRCEKINGEGLTHLGDLTFLSIVHNENMNGRIPDWIGEIPRLRTLIIKGNAFTGGLPSSLRKLEKTLIELNINESGLTGEIPDWIGEMKYLRRLNLTNAQLSGPIPVAITKLQELEVLDLSGNRGFSGTIPLFLGNMKSLQTLNLQGCNFTGEIPRALTTLTRLKKIDISHNNLTGTIPKEFGTMSQLEEINVGHNRLTGTIPEFTNGASVIANDNSFVGVWPPFVIEPTNPQQYEVGIPRQFHGLDLGYVLRGGTQKPPFGLKEFPGTSLWRNKSVEEIRSDIEGLVCVLARLKFGLCIIQDYRHLKLCAIEHDSPFIADLFSLYVLYFTQFRVSHAPSEFSSADLILF
jgi:Leucine-rich repeat (LRR) protein